MSIDITKDSPSWTALQLLLWAKEDFQKKGLEDARLSAEVLLAEALKTDRVGLYLRYDQPVSEEERSCFRKLVEMRRKKMPVAYILGRKEFYSLDFLVNSSVLIPRPETEILVDIVLELAANESEKNLSLIDVGTGSGAIAVALAKNLPEARIVATDVKPDALLVARKNAELNQVSIEFQESSLLENVSGSFEFILANLPYVSEEDRPMLASEVLDFEPHHALFAPDNGLYWMKKLLMQAQNRLRKGGKVCFEIGAGQESELSIFAMSLGYESRMVRRDLAGIPRILVFQESEKGFGHG